MDADDRQPARASAAVASRECVIRHDSAAQRPIGRSNAEKNGELVGNFLAASGGADAPSSARVAVLCFPDVVGGDAGAAMRGDGCVLRFRGCRWRGRGCVSRRDGCDAHFSGAVAEPMDAFVERRSLMPLRERVVRSGSGESPGDGMPPGGPVDLS